MAECLTPLEKQMCDFFIRVEIRGKRGRGMPVLLKPSMVTAMELLAGTREMCGMNKENIYMFARPGALSAYREQMESNDQEDSSDEGEPHEATTEATEEEGHSTEVTLSASGKRRGTCGRKTHDAFHPHVQGTSEDRLHSMHKCRIACAQGLKLVWGKELCKKQNNCPKEKDLFSGLIIMYL
ncbi:hypothetical protein F7725_028462 [Dissostichus mawsoni]|uniref:Uncharacterized protein n=1 Tax=Dissostichus mawsoni TaxID=36200 RepID=A0A7J5XFU8_DISMA|nr:hypothetical protein F7725_028462 [Dissostichus mawsoni]